MSFAAYLDPRGLGVTLSLCALTLAVMLSISSRALPHRMPGASQLTFGVALAACGLMGNMLQGWIPNFVAHFVGNAAIVAGLALVLAGTLRMRNEGVPTGALVGVTLVAWVGLAWFSVVEPSSQGRVVLVAAALAPLSAWTAWTAWQEQRQPYQAGFCLVTLFGGVFAVLMLARFITASILGTGADAVAVRPINVMSVLAGGLTLITGLIGMVFIHAGHLQDRLRWQAAHDALTGLTNRQGLRQWLQAQAPTASLVVVAIDLDQFKRVNDVYGHAVGDQVLVRLAHDLHAMAGDDVLAVRMGGAEFVLIQRLDNASHLVAMRRAMERLVFRVNVLREQFGRPEAQPHCTFSAGFATGQVREFERVMRDADHYRHMAKQTGRNRIVTPASQALAAATATPFNLNPAVDRLPR